MPTNFAASILSLSIVPLLFLITFLQIQIDFLNYYHHGRNSAYKIVSVQNSTLVLSWLFYSFYCLSMTILTYSKNTILRSRFHIPQLIQRTLYIFTFIAMIYFGYTIISVGFIEYLVSTRVGTRSIGFIGYSVLLFGPITAAIAVREHKPILSLCFILLLIFFNLITGFRLLLIWTAVVLYFFCFDQMIKLKVATIFKAIVIFGLTIYIYELWRQYALTGSLESSNNFLDSLNRTKILYLIIQLQSSSLKFFESILAATYCEIILVVNVISNATLVQQCALNMSDIVLEIWKDWIMEVYGSPSATNGISVPLMAIVFGLTNPITLVIVSLVFAILRFNMRWVKPKSELSFIFYFQYGAFLIMAIEAVNESAKLFFYITAINTFLIIGIYMKKKHYV